MLLRLLASTAVALSLGGCQDVSSQDAAATGPGHGDLAGLPLTPETRVELSTMLARMEAPEAQAFCSVSDLDFAKVSVTAFAVAMEAPETAPWSPAERARAAALRQKWEALGGDGRDIGQRCMDYLGLIDSAI